MDNNVIYKNLEQIIVNPKGELVYNSIFELLIAVILSSQCLDSRVNLVTKELFKVYNTPKQFMDIPIDELKNYIKSINFFNTKASHIIELSKIIVTKYNGQVPSDLENLITLPGVGRKTANVVMVEGFKKNAMPVDTHVFRVAHRLGISNAKNVESCEEDLIKAFPSKDYNYLKLHHMFILFGRYYCKAKNPKCSNCSFINICNETNKKGVN